jgi:hypothetical protein
VNARVLLISAGVISDDAKLVQNRLLLLPLLLRWVDGFVASRQIGGTVSVLARLPVAGPAVGFGCGRRDAADDLRCLRLAQEVKPQIILLVLIILGYLAGSIPFGLIVGLAKGVDPRKAGSGNIGATNVGRLLGGRFFAIVFTLDLLKSLIPMILGGLVVHHAARQGQYDWRMYLLWLLVGFAAETVMPTLPMMPGGSPGLRVISFQVFPASVVLNRPLPAPPLTSIQGLRPACQNPAYSTSGLVGSMIRSTAPVESLRNRILVQLLPPSIVR